MIRGTTLFICTTCKKVFLAPDVEYNAMALSVPMPCERCGSMRTLPMKLDYFVLSDELNPNEPLEKQLLNYSIYESIWKRMGKPDIGQADTPEEQYRTGMKYLDDKALSIRSSDTALYWLMKAARQGHAKAQYLTGVLLCGRCSAPAYLQHPPFCYTEGTVYQWISKAAEQGLLEAMCYLGNMYRVGYLVEKNFGKAFAWHLKAVKSDCAASEYAIACMYEQGEGVEQNTFRALRWCWKAALHGYAEAQLHLGIVYESTGKERHFHTAATFYQQATQQKSAEAWQRLASLYEMGKGVKQDFEKAWKYCLNAWEAGSEEAYKEAKRLLDEGLAHPDVSVVMEWYRECIDKGHKEMWYDLGKIYYEGKGIERNLKEARQCYLFAARTAHVAEAQYALGCMCERGEGVPANLHEAVRWYKEAAKQGHQKSAEICLRFASLYEKGEGVEQDFLKAWGCYISAWKAGSEKAYKEAKRLWKEGRVNIGISTEKDWYRKCIDKGHKEMWYDLGKMYYEGKEGERDLKEAFQCYGIAARTSHVAEAEYALGCMYERGEGVPANLQEAISWYQKAAKQGHTEAKAACRRLQENFI